MRVLAIACLAAAFGQGVHARDMALTLTWPDQAPAAELVAVARDAAGAVLEVVRQGIGAETSETVLSLPSLSRQASTLQIGAMVNGAMVLQSPRALVEGGQPPDNLTLNAALSARFASAYLCQSGRIVSLGIADLGITLSGFDKQLTLERTELAGRFRAEDGTIANRAPGLLQLEDRDGALLDSCQPIPTRPILPLTALGHDSQWRIETGLDGSVLTRDGAPQPTPDTPPERLNTRISNTAGNQLAFAIGPHVMTLTQEPCRLASADMSFPFTATLTSPDTPPSDGCAGDPLHGLEGAPWQVSHLFGQALPRDAEDTTAFTLQVIAGRLSGRTSCNRYLGRARVDAAKLQLTDLGTTRLSCPVNQSNLEIRFLDALETANGIKRLPDGGLALYAGPMAVLVARR